MQHCSSKVVVLFVSAKIVMRVGVLRGNYFCSIPQGDYQWYYSYILLEEHYQRRSPLLKSKPPPALNPLTAEWALRALKDFTLSKARRFYSSMGNPLAVKGLRQLLFGRVNSIQLAWTNKGKRDKTVKAIKVNSQSFALLLTLWYPSSRFLLRNVDRSMLHLHKSTNINFGRKGKSIFFMWEYVLLVYIQKMRDSQFVSTGFVRDYI